jgi:transposase-like protein
MTHQEHDNTFCEAMELLIENGFEGMADVMRMLFNEAMKIEREQALSACYYQRTPDRKGYANGFKPKSIDTRLGRIAVDVPQVRGDVEFYPSALEKGCRSERALNVAIAEMYVKGISTRKVTKVLEKMCGLSITSTQVSRVSKLLDQELEKWRNRKLGQYPYLVLDAHYEKVRMNGTVTSCAVFTAIGINIEGKREIIGVSVSLSEAEVHWREFIKSLISRGLHGVKYIVSDAHHGLKAAREALFNGVIWQRCQFHLQQNAQGYVPKTVMDKQVHNDIADIFNANDRDQAQRRLQEYVGKYAKVAPKLTEWMEENIPEGLNVFALPAEHRKRMRTSNIIERLHEEINRRTRVARLFPNEASLLRLVSAIEIEISEEWILGRKYLDMSINVENENENAISENKRIYRKTVA